MIGMPVQPCPEGVVWKRYSRFRSMLARLGAIDLLGRINTSSKSSFSSVSILIAGSIGPWKELYTTL